MDMGLMEKGAGITEITAMQNIEQLSTQMMQELDKDGDLKLSGDETGFTAAMLQKLDLDQDGKLNDEELKNSVSAVKDSMPNFNAFASALSQQPPSLEKFQTLMDKMSTYAKEQGTMTQVAGAVSGYMNSNG